MVDEHEILKYEKICQNDNDTLGSNSSVRVTPPSTPPRLFEFDPRPDHSYFMQSVIKFMMKWTLFTVFISSLLLLILWDLKTVQTLSTIIHDDHADFWIDLNSSELSHWFNPMNLCLLKIDSPTIDIESFRETNCSEYVDDTEQSLSLDLFCSVGTSLSKKCPPPLSSRSYFMKRLNDPYSGHSTNSKPLDITLMKLAARRQSLVFIGDGISKQNQIALICEIHRIANNNVKISGDFYGGNVTIEWPEYDLSLDIHYIYIRTLKNFANKNKGASSSTNNPSSSSSGSLNHPGSGSGSNNNSNYLSASSPLLKEKIQSLMESYAGLVVIANVGAWYNARDKFRSDIAPFLRWLGDIGKKNLIFFRETASQHWNHSNNGYFANDGSPAVGECVPLADSTPDLDWRNYDVEKYIENQELRSAIHLIKFRDITSPLYDMHPSSSEQNDCTHFCYFPQLWQSVWNRVSAKVFEIDDVKIATDTTEESSLDFPSRKRRRRRRNRRTR